MKKLFYLLALAWGSSVFSAHSSQDQSACINFLDTNCPTCPSCSGKYSAHLDEPCAPGCVQYCNTCSSGCLLLVGGVSAAASGPGPCVIAAHIALTLGTNQAICSLCIQCSQETGFVYGYDSTGVFEPPCLCCTNPSWSNTVCCDNPASPKIQRGCGSTMVTQCGLLCRLMCSSSERVVPEPISAPVQQSMVVVGTPIANVPGAPIAGVPVRGRPIVGGTQITVLNNPVPNDLAHPNGPAVVIGRATASSFTLG